MASNEHRHFESSVEMVDVVTELKRYAKTLESSKFVRDRRRKNQEHIPDAELPPN